MAYVITDKCLGEQYAQCVGVCPVDCIYPGAINKKPFMVIDPKLCTDCGICLGVCPVGAIVDSEDVDPKATKINKSLAPIFRENFEIDPRNPKEKPKKSTNTLVHHPTKKISKK